MALMDFMKFMESTQLMERLIFMELIYLMKLMEPMKIIEYVFFSLMLWNFRDNKTMALMLLIELIMLRERKELTKCTALAVLIDLF